MVETRAIRQAEARQRIVLSQLGADQREAARHLRINRALDTMRNILADETFLKLAHAHGIDSVPSFLIEPHDNCPLHEAPIDHSLDFLVSWRFFSPFLYEPMLSHLLEKRWPVFGLELRDIFIAIVADGPFPYDLRGRPRTP